MQRNIIIFILSLLISTQVLATTVLKVEMNELAQNAELVFEGKVLSKQVRASKSNGRPCTYFIFSVIDVIKGAYDQPEIELCFAGGTLNGLTMKVSDMTMPTVGETGIYFVDALGKEPIHPLLGWSQGHYLVKKDGAQIERVVPAFPQVNVPEGVAKRALNLQVSPDVETFKQMIRDQL